MKNYLVAVDLGAGVVGSCTVKMRDSYIPSSDNMKSLKEEVCKTHTLHKYQFYTGIDNHTYVGECVNGRITPSNIKIIAVSNLDI